ALWLFAIAYFSFRSYRKIKTANDYIFAGSKIGVFIGLLTFAATLFSAFTFMGMPDFFREHGVGSWIFLAISDAGMFFFILWFGHKLREQGTARGYRGVARLMNQCYESRWPGYLYFAAIFLFLVPYMAVQIRGIAIFFNAIFPEALPYWGWITLIVTIILIYTQIGGLRAIIYSDSLQALVLLFVIWIIGLTCLKNAGGLTSLFEQVKQSNEALLSIPGPKGLLTFQFLVISFWSIIMLPVTQPQITTRLIIMESEEKMHRMAVSLGVFAFLVLVPTIFIGLYGAINYGHAQPNEFLSEVLLFEQSDIIAALAVIGLLAASISTADSQIFALSTEFRSLMEGDEKRIMLYTRLAIIFFGIFTLVFSIVTTDQLVLLARVSFVGTSIMGPMIIAGIFSKRKIGKEIIWATLISLVLFIASQANIIPASVLGVRLDMVIVVFVIIFTLLSVFLRKSYAEKSF
ncbi:MAG TPA: sodium:solute symporter family protein, partial [Bacteroidetes bacterium]|nr:sodium:solute symporter family protein [Bacteroidota bacterium]